MRRVSTSDPILEQIQSNVASAFEQAAQSGISGGNIVSAQIASSDTLVNHRLGKADVKWFVVDIDQPVQIYKSSTTNKNPTKQLILKSSGATANVTLYIF